MVFRVKNVTFQITFAFCVVLALILLFDNGMAANVFLSVCVHESAHLFAMFICGAAVEQVRLEAFGILITRREDHLSLCKNAAIALAGCAANFLLVFVFLLVYYGTQKNAFLLLAGINFGLFFVNMLPVQGLDGGTLLLLIFRHSKMVKNGETTAKIISVITCVLLFAFGLILSFKVRLNLSLCAFSLFLLGQTFFHLYDND